MLRDILKQEIDQLSEIQLKTMADFIVTLKTEAQPLAKTIPFWQRATPAERTQDFHAWIAQLPKTKLSLPEKAFDRDSIYG